MSAQAVRNYDDAGILPPVERSETGYRRYTALHGQALRAFLALRRGHGHQPATEIMRAANRGDLESAYRLLDAGHVALLAERGTRTDVATALGALSTATPHRAGRPLTIGELARRTRQLSVAPPHRHRNQPPHPQPNGMRWEPMNGSSPIDAPTGRWRSGAPNGSAGRRGPWGCRCGRGQGELGDDGRVVGGRRIAAGVGVASDQQPGSVGCPRTAGGSAARRG